MIGRRSRSGLTLVELMIAAAIFSAVLGMGAAFFASQSRAATLQAARAETLDAARIALDLITWDIQNAGFNVPVSEGELLGIRALDDGIGPRDKITLRYFDRERADAGLAPRQRVTYWVVADTASLQRFQQDDVVGAPLASDAPTVASIVGLSLRYETRSNTFVAPEASVSGGPKECQNPDHEEVRDAAGKLVNCRVPWLMRDVPERLVKEVRVQVLARSIGRVQGHVDSNASYRFADGSSIATQPGYVYHFAEQVVLAPNLGR